VPIINCLKSAGSSNIKIRDDKTFFQLCPNTRQEKSHVEHIILIKYFPAHSQLLRNKPDRCNASAFPVTPVMHQAGRLVNMAPRNRFGTTKADNAAPAFFLTFFRGMEKIKLVDESLF
jgi:hypothetical protein